MELNFNRCMDGEEQATTWCRPSSVEHHEDEEEEEGAIIAMAKAAISELKMMSKARLLGFPSSLFAGLSADPKDRRRRALQFLSLFSSLFIYLLNLNLIFHFFHFVFRHASFFLPSVFFLFL